MRRARLVPVGVAALLAVTAAGFGGAAAGRAQATPAPTGPMATTTGTTTAATPTVLTASRATPRKCFGGRVRARSTDGFAVTAPLSGLARVRLTPIDAAARTSDWDVAVFGRDGAVVGASAGPRSDEVADGFVRAGDRLWVQGCRYAGRADRVRVSVSFAALPAETEPTDSTRSLVSVATPTAASRVRLARLGLDVTETSGAGRAEVVLHDRAEADALRASGLRSSVQIADLGAQEARDRSADRAYAAAVARSPLPSGRTSYRHLYDYDYELKELARLHPDLVRLDVLPRRTSEGRDITAVEITRHARRIDDGKPIFLDLGLLHAREWPSGELPMEFALDLVKNYGHDARITRLVRAARTIVLPVVNPDGFSVSRQAIPRGDFSTFDFEDMRKDCDPAGAPTALLRSGPCPVNPAGVDRGTDLNRNFGGYWGGDDTSTDWAEETYRGTGPFSAPETEAVRELVSGRSVTNVIGNHTAGDVVLRPPGLAAAGEPVDSPLYSSLARAFTAHNHYADFRIYQLYDAAGGSDDWFYWVTGAISFSFEIGTEGFHPAFADAVVGEYLGRAPAAGAGHGGDRAAYLAMLSSTATKADHATLTGRAPKGWTLQVERTFRTPTAPVVAQDGSVGAPRLVTDTLSSTLRSTGGRFSWAVNPSTRPYVAGRYGRVQTAPTQPTIALANPPGHPGLNDNGDPDLGPREIVPFTVAKPPTADNGSATVSIGWRSTETTWFLFVLDPHGTLVGEAYGSGPTSSTVTLPNPEPGAYRAVIENFSQPSTGGYDDWSGTVTFAAPNPPPVGVREAWTLTCRRPNGSIARVRQVIVDRGQSRDLGSVCGRR